MKNKKLSTLIALVLFSTLTFAQGTLADYNRAYSMKEKYSSKNVFYSNITPEWIDKTPVFWYIRNTPNGKFYIVVNADKKTNSVLFDTKKLALELNKASEQEVKAENLSLLKLQVNHSLDSLSFVFNGKNWNYAIKTNKLTDNGLLPPIPKPRNWMEVDDEKDSSPVPSPDGKYTAYIKDNNIYVKDLSTEKEKRLSIDGTTGNYYSAYIQWSPDSKKVASFKIRPVEKNYVYYVESSPSDQLQPKLHKQEYTKPGDELRFKTPGIFDIKSGSNLIPSTALFSHQYDLTGLKWNKNSKAITFEYNQRGHQVYRVLEMSAETGNVRTIVNETSDTYVNYPRYFRYDLSDETQLIWMSERDNWNHLYMYNRLTGEPEYQITKGHWYVREVIRVDEKKKQIYFSANGMKKDEDPYLIRYYRIDFDGKNLTCLTPEEGMHQAWFSADMKYLVDVYSMVNKAPIAVLREAKDGKIIMPLEKADISQLLTNGWKAPEVFKAKGRDEKTDMWGIIIRPSNFDPNKKYPVIEYIYSGPGDQYVPKKFISYNWNMTAIAELGFIVVQVDGMGTSFRSRAFENMCYKNLKDAGLPDHIAWLKAAAEKYPQMDITRVGIFGASAGGQESTAAVLFHPEFYKAAYSACGCHDNRMDKIWWNELWMGYPIGKQYEECSNVTNAHLLKHPLMLVVGELDDNVDPSSTMQLVNALIKANKNFELIVLPGIHHTMGESFGEHKRFDFFTHQLLHTNPPTWSLVKYK
ncbi:MAG: DPP IV N-terminal domain-containing protein [Bacteroidaceae bacterium]|nr:S9 family peptidase [Bacteroidaceae bacterium]